ncbi:hypothetical protein ACH5HS_20520 [Bacillus paralicheniformis]|uniref:hypothetical protein n=1 Tax=Bacillus paralicheniformis TaxID=1648923 RepID=UPI0037BEEB2F
MIVGMIGFILVGFFLYAAMAPSDGNNSGSSSSTFFVRGPDSSGDSGSDFGGGGDCGGGGDGGGC